MAARLRPLLARRPLLALSAQSVFSLRWNSTLTGGLLNSRISDARSVDELLELYEGHAHDMRNDFMLGNLWNKLGRKLKERRLQERRRFLQVNEVQLNRLLETTISVCAESGCDARGLTNMAHGVVKGGLLTRELGRNAHALLDTVGDRLHPLVDREFHPQMVSNACWAYASAQHPSPAVFAAVSHAICATPSRPGTLEPQVMSNLTWAFAKIGCADEPLFDTIAQVAQRRLAEFSPQQLSNLAWAFATVEHADPTLFDAVAGAVLAPIRSGRTVRASTRLRIDEFNPQALGNTAWAFITMGHHVEGLHERLADTALERLAEFSPADLSQLLSAFSRTAHAPTPALFEAARAAVPRMSFTPVQLAALTSAFVASGHETEALLGSLTDAAVRTAGGFGIDAFVTISWALALAGDAPNADRFVAACLADPRSCLNRPLDYRSPVSPLQLIRLRQALLWWEVERGEHPPRVPRRLEVACVEALAAAESEPFAMLPRLERRSEVTQAEHAQQRQRVARASFALSTLRVPHTPEVQLAEGYAIDIALPERKLAVLLESPRRYDRLARADGTYAPTVATRMRWRQLAALGWTPVQLPFYEWDGLIDPEARREYVSRKLDRQGIGPP